MFIPLLTFLPDPSHPVSAVYLFALLVFIIAVFRFAAMAFSGINSLHSGGFFGYGQLEPPHPFTTDGCSGGMTILWNKFFGCDPPWNDLCEQHDKHYWRGGTRAQRRKADAELRDGVAARGYHVWAWLIWAGVRVGGVPWLPTSWRWAYGWDFPHDYSRG